MAADGKQLERLVSFVEKTLQPQGFSVKENKRVYNADGVQIAEFDIEIRGKVDLREVAWLIECRDRPSDGPAPGEWIEQLVGRRIRFGYNRVTAVSTTGFAAGALEFARTQGIETRNVNTISPEEFENWLAIDHIQFIEKITTLHQASILVHESEGEDRKRTLREVISSEPSNAAFLKSLKTGVSVSPAHAFSCALSENSMLFDDLVPNGPGKKVRLNVQYTNDDDHYVVETSVGAIRVQGIIFEGELHIKRTLLPLALSAEYCYLESGQPISQFVAFSPQVMHSIKLSMEMHRLAESDETQIILRRVQSDALTLGKVGRTLLRRGAKRH